MSPGTRFGNYVLAQRLAAGGMAEVWRAQRVGAAGFSRSVCVKVILPSLAAEREFVEMFIDEARTGAQLRHGNIVGIDDFGRLGEHYYLAMEFVGGTDLLRLERALAQAGRALPLDVAVYITREVLTALDYAHRKLGEDGRPLGVIHRDVSPHNLLLSFAGEVKLSDFGIARAATRLHHTRGEVVKGKIAYMAPEQARGGTLDARVDLFALGVVFYEMVVGRRPFVGDGNITQLEALVFDRRDPVLVARPDTPPAIARVIERLLAHDVNDRYASAADALHDLADHPIGTGTVRELAALVAMMHPADPDAATSLMPPVSVSHAGSTLTRGDAAVIDEAASFAPTVVDATSTSSTSLPSTPVDATRLDAIGVSPGGTAILPSPVDSATDPTRAHDATVGAHTNVTMARESSATAVTRTLAASAVPVITEPHRASPLRTTSTRSRETTRALTVAAFAALAISAVALGYVLFAH